MGVVNGKFEWAVILRQELPTVPITSRLNLCQNKRHG